MNIKHPIMQYAKATHQPNNRVQTMLKNRRVVTDERQKKKSYHKEVFEAYVKHDLTKDRQVSTQS